MRNIYMGEGSCFEDLENKDKRDRKIIRPEINTENIFKTGEVSFNVSKELQKDTFTNLNNYTSRHSKNISISQQANKLVNRIENYCNEVLPPKTIKEIENKFKENNFECEYVHFDLTFIRIINILKNIPTDSSKKERLLEINKIINYLESNKEIKEEFLLTFHELKQDIISLKDIEEGLIHYSFKIIENYFTWQS